MSILTYMKSIPLFSTPLEAITWGRQRGLTGYHSHTFNVRTGYMAGTNHKQAVKGYGATAAPSLAPIAVTPVIPVIPIVPVIPTTPTAPTIPLPTSGGGGGGGGY